MTPAELIYSKFEMTRDQVNKTGPRLQTREQSLVSSLRSLQVKAPEGEAAFSAPRCQLGHGVPSLRTRLLLAVAAGQQCPLTMTPAAFSGRG